MLLLYIIIDKIFLKDFLAAEKNIKQNAVNDIKEEEYLERIVYEPPIYID